MEIKPKNIRPFHQKEVLLFEWWLAKTKKGYCGRTLAVGGFTKSGETVSMFRSAPIIKFHDARTLGTADEIALRINGPINETRTIDNGYSIEACNAFKFGFPTIWEDFDLDSFGNKPSNLGMPNQQQEATLDPSVLQKTVLLRNWWLKKVEKGTNVNRLAVGGVTECGKAMRVFDSSPILARHDAFTLETDDEVTIRIQGFINEAHTIDNGFNFEVCKAFLFGFPTTWTDYVYGSSCYKSAYAKIPVNTSRSAEELKDFFENKPPEFSVITEKVFDTVPSASNTSTCDPISRLQEASRSFKAAASMFSHVHMPSAGQSSHHLPEKSVCYNNRLQDDDSCETNMTDPYAVDNDIKCAKAGHSAIGNDSKNHEAARCTKVHIEGAVHLLDHAGTKGLDDEPEGTGNTGILTDFEIGKDHVKEEFIEKENGKFFECSSLKSNKVGSSLSRQKSLYGKQEKYAKSLVKPVRRSLRLISLKSENVHGELQDNSQLPNETVNVSYVNLTLAGVKLGSSSHSLDTLIQNTSNPTHISNSCLSMSTTFENDIKVDVLVETHAEHKASSTDRCKTVWVSSYDVYHTPFTRNKLNKLFTLTPESQNIKRSRAGRCIIPRLDLSSRVMYEPDGSFAGTCSVDGSSTATASAASQCEGSGTKKRKRHSQYI